MKENDLFYQYLHLGHKVVIRMQNWPFANADELIASLKRKKYLSRGNHDENLFEDIRGMPISIKQIENAANEIENLTCEKVVIMIRWEQKESYVSSAACL